MLAVLNILILLLFVLANGGRYDWAYQWGSWLLLLNSIPLIYIMAQNRMSILSRGPCFWILGILLPWGAFAGLFIFSLSNPSLLPVDGHLFSSLELQRYISWLPTTANPERGGYFLRLLLGVMVMFLAVICVPTRRAHIRTSVLILILFGALLALVGGMTKLMGSGKMFGILELREPIAYATMFYKNQWAYFALLCAAAGCACFHYTLGRELQARHFPERALALALLVVACLVSIPLAQARGGTLLALILAVVFVYSVCRKLFKGKRSVQIAVFLLMITGGIWGISQVASSQLRTATLNTREQIEAYQQKDLTKVKRLALYRDTWEMVRDRPLWGWGIGSFIHIHPIYAGLEFYQPNAELPIAYEFAHCDYLEMLAEMGVAGVALLLIPLVILLIGIRRSGRWGNQFTPWLLLGAGLVAIAATFDMVFSNPALAIGTALFVALGIRYAAETYNRGYDKERRRMNWDFKAN